MHQPSSVHVSWVPYKTAWPSIYFPSPQNYVGEGERLKRQGALLAGVMRWHAHDGAVEQGADLRMGPRFLWAPWQQHREGPLLAHGGLPARQTSSHCIPCISRACQSEDAQKECSSTQAGLMQIGAVQSGVDPSMRRGPSRRPCSGAQKKHSYLLRSPCRACLSRENALARVQPPHMQLTLAGRHNSGWLVPLQKQP